MKKILIDLNVILDFLNKREGHQAAAHIFDYCVSKKVSGFLCSHEITTLAYFLSKEKIASDKVIQILSTLFINFEIIPGSKDILESALYSGISDYEDAVIERSAILHDVDFIVTRNIKDFSQSNIPCIHPQEAIVHIKKYLQ